MKTRPDACPMTRGQVIDTYFIENRTKLLDLAAFLDRLDRAPAGGDARDFRMQAFQEALAVLCSGSPSRTTQVQMIFSDPTTEPREALDQKSACGAYDHWK
jgi:hypothetical protein